MGRSADSEAVRVALLIPSARLDAHNSPPLPLKVTRRPKEEGGQRSWRGRHAAAAAAHPKILNQTNPISVSNGLALTGRRSLNDAFPEPEAAAAKGFGAARAREGVVSVRVLGRLGVVVDRVTHLDEIVPVRAFLP